MFRAIQEPSEPVEKSQTTPPMLTSESGGQPTQLNADAGLGHFALGLRVIDGSSSRSERDGGSR